MHCGSSPLWLLLFLQVVLVNWVASPSVSGAASVNDVDDQDETDSKEDAFQASEPERVSQLTPEFRCFLRDAAAATPRAGVTATVIVQH